MKCRRIQALTVWCRPLSCIRLLVFILIIRSLPRNSKRAWNKAFSGMGSVSEMGSWKARKSQGEWSGDMVVFFEGRDAIGFDRMKPKGIWQCRHGVFHHDEMVGKPFGSRVFSRTTKGYVYALSATPELWCQAVLNRTQIVQDFDQSIVIFRLDLKPGDVVVESGTGSGVMSSAIMRTIAPHGYLHTFEFNEIRAKKAEEEFVENGLGDIVRVVHRDVCAPRYQGGSFGEDLDGKADAVFLDLPEPWLAVEHAKLVLKPGRKLCAYSPCIEQVMKTCEALRAEGFNSVTTIEFRLRSFNHSEIKLEVPDFGPAAATSRQPEDPTRPRAIHGTESDGTGDSAAKTGDLAAKSAAVVEVPSTTPPGDILPKDGESTVEGSSKPGSTSAIQTSPAKNGTDSEVHSRGMEQISSAGAGDSSTGSGLGDVGDEERNIGSQYGVGGGEGGLKGSNKRSRESEREGGQGQREGENQGTSRSDATNGSHGRSRRSEGQHARDKGNPLAKLLCAQAYPIMRGHTAFLTFACTPPLPRGTAAATAAAVVSQEQHAPGASDTDVLGGNPGNGNADSDREMVKRTTREVDQRKVDAGQNENTGIEEHPLEEDTSARSRSTDDTGMER